MSISVLNSALELATQKVRFFQVVPNAKTPAVDKFSEKATSDETKLREMFAQTNFNSGIACGRVDHDLYLVGLDIDDKDGRKGYQTMDDLDMIGQEFPDTWSQKTPSGGEHRLFWSPVPIRQGTDVLGRGVDLRGEGGYLVGPGSSIDGKPYTKFHNLPIAQAPKWFIEKFQKKNADVIELRKTITGTPVNDQVFALKRSIRFLTEQPAAPEGSRNDLCYKVVCKIKDFGLDKTQIPDILEQFWKCEPPLEPQEIMNAINSAFKYGKNEAGVDAPENVFDAIPTEANEVDFIDDINKKFFFIAVNGVSRVCEETEDNDEYFLKRHSVQAFHDLMAPKVLKIKDKDKIVTKVIPKSKEWLKNSRRREYNFIKFIPKDDVPKGVFNLWRGFKSKPMDKNKIYSDKAIKGYDTFLAHCRDNICDGNVELFGWLMDFVAHMFQKPWEKPPVALVFHGEKGVGKNVFIDVLTQMIGRHAATISDRGTLTSNFNSIMEDKILIAFDEAFWSGDKSTEGKIKGIITSSTRNIERKGEDQYNAKVYDRIIIMGNEDRLVNATADERRYAAFNVASHQRGNQAFFRDIMVGICEQEGHELLMSYFLERDISEFDVRKAPETEGLRQQKEQSLSNFESWFHQCLISGQILGNGCETWPISLKKSTLRDSYHQYLKMENIKDHQINIFSLGKKFKKMAPSCSRDISVRENNTIIKAYVFSSLAQARSDWDMIYKLGDIWE